MNFQQECDIIKKVLKQAGVVHNIKNIKIISLLYRVSGECVVGTQPY